jgi:hypothetical protein
MTAKMSAEKSVRFAQEQVSVSIIFSSSGFGETSSMKKSILSHPKMD